MTKSRVDDDNAADHRKSYVVENDNSSIIADLLSNAMAVSAVPMLVFNHSWLVRTCLLWRSPFKDTELRRLVVARLSGGTPRHLIMTHRPIGS